MIGAALIGGFGWLTGAYGMALDNIVSATVVLKGLRSDPFPTYVAHLLQMDQW